MKVVHDTNKIFAHPWNEDLIQNLGSVTVGGTPSTSIAQYWRNEIPWMSSGDVHLKKILDVPGRISTLGLNASNATLVPAPSVAVALAGQGKTRGTVALVLKTICTNQSVALIKTDEDKLNITYIFYNLEFRYEELRSRSAGGGRAGLSKGILEQLPIPLPIIYEQDKIADLLSTVDRAIAQTEALIAKQQRIKTGLMQDFLTKGIDEHGNIRSEETHEFKDSAIGRIPVEWEVTSISDIARAIDPQPDHRTPPIVADGVPYIGVSDFKADGAIDFKNARKVSQKVLDKQSRVFKICEGDFIFGKIGTIGVPKRIPTQENYTLSANVILIKPDETPLFVYWWMTSPMVERMVEIETNTTSQPAFGIQKIRNLYILKPDRYEREKIGGLIEHISRKIEKLEKSVSKFKALKLGLMQDLLTGKVRVTSLLDNSGGTDP
ncbi:MAG: restriction endonuclease subunit S [Planktothrix sp.]